MKRTTPICCAIVADPAGHSIDEHDAWIKSEIAKRIKVASAASVDPQ